MIIRDSIHGNVVLSEFEQKIVDCSEFQRLRRIKQLAMAYLVYPGAMHTRFEHSLGTMHLASGICESLGIIGEERERVRTCALLHDVGHSAFSHESEFALSKLFGSHEDIGKKKMGEGEIGEILSGKFSGLGEGIEKTIIAGDVGADRMDYLLRDAHHIGVSYGTIDVDRIIHTLELDGKELVVGRGGLEATETLLVGRFMMFSTVYLHKTVRIASAMLNRAIFEAVNEGMEPAELLEGTDEGILERILQTKRGGEYAKALLGRRLYKQAYSVDGVLVNPEVAEKELTEECGCEVLVNLPSVLSKQLSIKIKEDGLREIMEVSDLVKSLFLSEEKRKKTLILCNKENKEKVKKVAEAYFN